MNASTVQGEKVHPVPVTATARTVVIFATVADDYDFSSTLEQLCFVESLNAVCLTCEGAKLRPRIQLQVCQNCHSMTQYVCGSIASSKRQ